ncbi:mannitol-1-phosphate 5-dehydrogenase [Paenibacillus tianjinensis]|uniref:Mannitol-1-phosphate 5-dehydrogenase n=1 Tax=Paenibacillus tianjinensis TaxID=2810347 RepID=A0ABX7LJD8_9BACL|nr:mannitol-1-phosphate 5-dehydrogenase [Paenibacillus tianjinensis]QSF46630.1 mannitol-1-phosphate 5-dehydrogenase [Paenibacillus tianjinensis]
MRAVHFGAGNIGRGFIGPMLSKSGYKVCFVGRNKKQITQLQKRGQYQVTLANEDRDSFIVSNVTAIHIGEADDVAKAIAEAEIVTTAVGILALKDIASSIARGIELRLKSDNPKPLHVFACENGIKSSRRLKESVYLHLKHSFREKADHCIAFPNVMVDRIVPVQKNKDSLEILVEPYKEWVIPRSEIMSGYNEIQGAHYVNSLDPYLERKLYTVNTGHCCAAYFGYLEGYSSIQEAMSDPGIRSRVRGVLQETGALLVHLYGFDPAAHHKYINKMMKRFENPHFNDSITRVARSPLRKLSPTERLIQPAMLAFKYGLEVNYLVRAIASALFFDYRNDEEALQLQEAIRKFGLSEVISTMLMIPADHPLHGQIIGEYHKIRLQNPHMTGSSFESMINSLRL